MEAEKREGFRSRTKPICWHNFQGYDPEIVTGILGGAQYPQLKTVTFGINLGF